MGQGGGGWGGVGVKKRRVQYVLTVNKGQGTADTVRQNRTDNHSETEQNRQSQT